MAVQVAPLLLLVGLVSLFICLVTHACVLVVLRRRRLRGPTPPISVLKPLKGTDPHLFENLASVARQDYPEFEILFGCEDAMDPGLAVARAVQRAHPGVPMTLVAGGRSIGYNPKVNNLVQLARAARHDWLLVSDADVRVDATYLRAVAAETVDPSVGLVSSVIAGVDDESLGAALDCLHLNGFIASSVCGADVLCGHPCVIGKSMLFRKSDFLALGGFHILKDVLAEDYVLGRAYRRAGFRVALSGHPIRAVCGTRSVEAFFKRHLRWSQMRRHLSLTYVGEPLLLPMVWLMSALLLALSHGRTMSPADGLVVALSLAAMATKLAADAWLGRRLRGHTPTLGSLVLLPLKDVVILAAWITAWFKNTAEWRGNDFHIGSGSTLTRVNGHAGTAATARHG